MVVAMIVFNFFNVKRISNDKAFLIASGEPQWFIAKELHLMYFCENYGIQF